MRKTTVDQRLHSDDAIPKAVKVENMATILKITFDNDEIRYLRSHMNKDIVKHPLTRKKANGKRSIFSQGHVINGSVQRLKLRIMAK